MRGFCRARGWNHKMRVHPVYIIEQKRVPLDSTISMQAEKRTTEIKRWCGGGHWFGESGTGEAWLYPGVGERLLVRPIRRGRWDGPWRVGDE